MKRLSLLLATAFGLAVSSVAAEDVDVLFVGYYQFASPAWLADMAAKGVHVQLPLRADRKNGDPALYTPELLRKFHVVVVSGAVGRKWSANSVGKVSDGLVERLFDYRKAGGSVVWMPTGLNPGIEDWNETIGRRIGVEALHGWVTNETTKSVFKAGGGSIRGLSLHTRTDDIVRHPVTAGVRNLWINPRGEWGSEGAIAERFGDGWICLVRLCGKDLVGVKDDPTGGRMALWPLYTAFTWGNYGHVALGKVFMEDGDGNIPSDGMRLAENLFRWLAEPARKRGLGGAHLNPVEKPPERKSPDLKARLAPPAIAPNWTLGRSWPGLLGAQSAQGGGRGTAREWAAAGRQAGLSWIAFVDDVTKHTPESYAQLVRDCAEATTDDFYVLPGLGGWDAAGYYRYYVNARRLPGKDTGFLDGRGRIALPHRIVVGPSGWDVFGGLAYYGKMPSSAWYPWICSTASVLTYDETGGLVDDGVVKWERENEWGTSFLSPVSLVVMRSPSVVADRAKRCHRTVFRGEGLVQAVREGFRTGTSENAGRIYPTSGPEIVYWGSHDVGNACPWGANADRAAFALIAKSDVGIVRVLLRDASDGRVLRDLRYDRAKTVSEFVMRGVHDRQASYTLIVTDADGGTAVAQFNLLYPSNRLPCMTDRLMGMWHWLEPTDETPPYLQHFGGLTPIPWSKNFGFSSGMPDNPTPQAMLKVKGIDGGKVSAPSQHLDFRMEAVGETPERYSFLFHQVLASHDATVFDKDARQVLAPGEKFVFEGCVPKMENSVVAVPRVRTYGTRQRSTGDYYALPYEIEVEFLRAAKVTSIFLNAGRFAVVKGDWNRWNLRTAADGEVLQETLPDDGKFAVRHEMRQGGYTYIGPNLGGSAAFLAHDVSNFVFTVDTSCEQTEKDPSFISRANRVTLRFPEKGGRAFAKGEKLRFGVMLANRKFGPGQESNDWLEKMVKDFGIGTGRPGFAYTLSKGVFRGCNWFFDVDAQKGAAKLAIPRNDLGQRLPVRVRGLSPQAIHGEYNNRTRRVRILPLVPDTGELVTTYDTAARATDVTLGDFVRWTNPAAVVTMMPEGLDFVVEAHNPTAKPITVRLAGNAAFAPFALFRAELELRPHETRALKVGAPGGSVSDAVHF